MSVKIILDQDTRRITGNRQIIDVQGHTAGECLDDLVRQGYWKRLVKSGIRVKQALRYGCNIINELTGRPIFSVRKTEMSDVFIRDEIHDAIERVIELG